MCAYVRALGACTCFNIDGKLPILQVPIVILYKYQRASYNMSVDTATQQNYIAVSQRDTIMDKHTAKLFGTKGLYVKVDFEKAMVMGKPIATAVNLEYITENISSAIAWTLEHRPNEWVMPVGGYDLMLRLIEHWFPYADMDHGYCMDWEAYQSRLESAFFCTQLRPTQFMFETLKGEFPEYDFWKCSAEEIHTLYADCLMVTFCEVEGGIELETCFRTDNDPMVRCSSVGFNRNMMKLDDTRPYAGVKVGDVW